MKLHTGDTVLVITGKDKGKTGQVTKVLTEKNHVVVQGLNMRVRHIKKTAQGPGSKIRFEASLDASKVMLLDPKSGKPTRIGYQIDAKTGKKVRIALVSGAPIVGAAKAKALKKSAAKAGEAAEAAPKTEVAANLPAKRAFWKRGDSTPAKDGTAATDGESSAAGSAAADAEMKHTPIVRRAGRGK